jgi:hypothetical protein
MSSMPLTIGLPVVDRLGPVDGSVILRTKTRDEMVDEVNRIQEMLSKNDLIKVCPIGLRPDKPIPTAMYFTEICISKNKAEEWMFPLGLFIGAWHCVVTGRVAT